MYNTINVVMHTIHFAVIGFYLLGFIVEAFLPFYLMLQLLILFSRLGYGFYDGRWGMCIITDIQWYYKERNGQRPATESFVDYWIKHKRHFEVKESTTEAWMVGIFALTSLIGVLRWLGWF